MSQVVTCIHCINRGFNNYFTPHLPPKGVSVCNIAKKNAMRFSIQPKYYNHNVRPRTSIIVQASFFGKVIKKGTGITIPTNAWDRKKKELKKTCPGWTPAEQIHAHAALDSLKQVLAQRALQIFADEQRNMNEAEFTEILDAFVNGARDVNREELPPEEVASTQHDLLEYIEAFIPTAMKRRNKHAKNEAERITATTVQQYTQLLPVLRHFRNYTGESMDFRNVDVRWHDKFLEWGADVEYMGAATLGKHIKSLKRLFYYAKKDGLEVHTDPLTNEDFDKPRQPKNEIQYLTREELERIKALDLKGKPGLSLERDRLIIGCWTGLRVSDLGRLNSSMIKPSASGRNMIHIWTQKTQKKVVIPILTDVQEIIDRRGGFPKFHSEQVFNRAIKKICCLAEINAKVEGQKQGTVIIKRRDDKGRPYQEEVKRKVAGTFEKWELITTHSCRRSFASNWYGSMPNQVIMKITGHSKEEDFLRYVGVTEEENAERFLKIWEEIMRRNGLL